MFERQYTRIDSIRQVLDDMLKNCGDLERARNGFVHLYGVGQACALLALHRGHDRTYAELAEVAGMLHDYSKYKDGIEDDHAKVSSVEAKKVLAATGQFSDEDITLVCEAIRKHCNKDVVDGELDEIVKDADDMQHWLRNPAEEYFILKDRTKKIIREFELLKL